jgi:hypothetical protein
MRANNGEKANGKAANSKCISLRPGRWFLAFAFVCGFIGNLSLFAQTTQVILTEPSLNDSPEMNGHYFANVTQQQQQPEASLKDSPELNGNYVVNVTQQQPEASAIMVNTSSSIQQHSLPETEPAKKEAAGDYFSFCLLIKDDNDLLNEWIAYHYHVLKLRHLVVAVDPDSTTSPSPILQAWRKNFGLEVDEWTDQTYMPEFFLQGDYKQVPEMTKKTDVAAKLQNGENVTQENLENAFQKINQHRYRQVTFLKQCMIHVKKRNCTWMAHVDTDEFIVINPTVRKEGMVRNLTLGQNTIFSFLKERAKSNSKVLNWPCISMPRLLFGAHKDEVSGTGTFAANRTQFETLRWKYHAVNASEHNKLPKAIIDLNGVPSSDLQSWNVFSIHRPSTKLCRGRKEMKDVTKSWKLPLVVNHYIGSLDRYLARKDARRSPEIYWEKANVTDSKDDDWINGWLDSFVSTHGQPKASTVLGGYMDSEIGNN